ncbi:hypothetical protein Tco_0312100 [Tanacetum coccineum]
MAEFWYSAKALENSKVSFSISTGGIFGEVGVNTFRNAIGAHYLPHSSEYVAPPSINVVRQWFTVIGYGEEALKPNQLKEPPFTDHMLAICAVDKPVVFKAPKTSSKAESVSQGTKPGAQTGHKKPLTSSKQPSVEKSPTRPMDSNPNQPPVSTPVDTGMHKKDKQATSGPTSLGVTSEERANLQLNSGMDLGSKNTSYDHTFAGTDPYVLVYQTKSISEGLETVLTQPITGKRASSSARQVKEEASSIIKLEDLAKLVSNVEPSFKDLASPEDDLVIVVDDSDEDEEDGVHPTPNAETEDTLVPKSSSPNSLPTELKDLPSKFKDLTEEVKGLKNQVHNLEIKFPRDLKEIPPKLEDFTKTVTSLTSQVAELKTLQWELPVEFLVVLLQVEMVQAKLKTLDAPLSLLNKVTNALNQFAQAITSKKTRGDSVPLAGQAGTQPAEGEKNTNQATISQLFQRRAEKENLNKQQPKRTTPSNPPEDKGKKALSLEEAKKESTDSDFDDETHVTGSMVEPYRTKKLNQFTFITEDGRHIHLTEEGINHQKKLEGDAKAEATKPKGEVRKVELVDLLGPEMVKSTRMDYIHKVEAELGINLDIPLSKQGPLDKLNDLENKKRKHADEIHDYFKANKRLKLSVQYEDHLPGTVLNEPVLEIFFRLHQGPGLDDHARTFSSLLLAKVDKRNLNPLKKMRIIEQLRQ